MLSWYRLKRLCGLSWEEDQSIELILLVLHFVLLGVSLV
ncbi:hypothetical protein Gorai_009590, partial [Gossypium raimondii]|nr:hypothetical protein [Gossypium raimondii]